MRSNAFWPAKMVLYVSLLLFIAGVVWVVMLV